MLLSFFPETAQVPVEWPLRFCSTKVDNGVPTLDKLLRANRTTSPGTKIFDTTHCAAL
jgi:hypothetical protein